MLPNNLYIGGMAYQIVEIERLIADDGRRKLTGNIRYDECEIRIEAGMEAQATRQIIWHEILHGILTQAGHQEAMKESAVDALAYGIVDVLKQNPWLRAKNEQSNSDAALSETTPG